MIIFLGLIIITPISNVLADSDYAVGEIKWMDDGYLITDKATIYLIDPDLNQNSITKDEIEISVWSETDVGGIHVTLIETGKNTGIFEGTVTFTETSSDESNSILRITIPEYVGASYSDRTLPILPNIPSDRLVISDEVYVREPLPFSTTRLLLHDPGILDENFDETLIIEQNKPSTIFVYVENNSVQYEKYLLVFDIFDSKGEKIKTLSGHDSIDLNNDRYGGLDWIPEMPGTYYAEISVFDFNDNSVMLSPPARVDFTVISQIDENEECQISDTFTDNTLGKIEWSDSFYNIDDQPIIRILDSDLNQFSDIVDIVEIDIWSDSDAGGIDLVLYETGLDTGIFAGSLFLTAIGNSDGKTDTLHVSPNDKITAEYEDSTLPSPYSIDDELNIIDTSSIIIEPKGNFVLDGYEIFDKNNVLSQIFETGNSYNITVDLSNKQNQEQHFAYALFIEDPTDNNLDPIWITGFLPPHQSSSLELSWTPKMSGQYNHLIEIWDDPEPNKRNIIAESINFSVLVEGGTIFTDSEKRDIEIAKLKDQVKELQTTIKNINDSISSPLTISNKESTLQITSFVDTNKDPQYYLERYYNEPKYKEWFDKNYPDYTIEEAVGVSSTPEKITKDTKLPKWVQNIFIWYAENRISENELLDSIEFLLEQEIIQINNS